MTIDNETESVLRASFKVILGDQYRDDLHLCRLAGLVENRLLTLNRTGWQVSFDLCDRLRYELSKKLIKVFTSEAETILLTVRDLIDDENKPQGADESVRPILIPVFGLKAQGHIPTIQRMLAEGKTWEDIGREIGWDPGTAEEFYIRECPPNAKDQTAGALPDREA